MKKHLLILLGALLALPAFARDFEYTHEGQTLTYTVIDENAMTCQTKAGYRDDYYNYFSGNNVTGDLIIPSTVEDEGQTYRVTAIGDYAFYSCTSLISVTIPETVISIGRYTFDGCIALISVAIPNSVTKIGDDAFRGCRVLTSITIPNSVTEIGDEAFYRCSALTSVIIGTSVTSIGRSMFSGCSSLTSITIPHSITEIGDEAFYDCSGLTSVSILEGLTSIGFSAFRGCSCLTSVTIPNSVIEIGGYAFYRCGGLTSVTIPNSVKIIGNSAFSSCFGLTSVIIGNSVTEIGGYAFYDCTGLVSITVKTILPPRCGYYDELCDYSKVTLYVPQESVEAYKTAEVWKNFTNIVGYKTSETVCIENLHYEINLISKTASVTYAEQNSLSNYEGMQGIIIPETVEYDGESYTVTAIGDEAFNNCWGLKAVSLPSTLQTVGKLAFGYCTSLRSVTIPENVTTIDNEAFTGCSALASVEIGSSVETIGDYAFFGCTGLATLHVPESVKTIGENAFMGIHWINEVHAKSAKPADAPSSAFSTNAYRNATLVVPDEAVDTYRAHPTWSNFLAISPVSGTPTRIEVVDGAIVVKGSGEVSVYDMKGAQVYSGAAGRIELPAGIYLVATDSLTRKVKI